MGRRRGWATLRLATLLSLGSGFLHGCGPSPEPEEPEVGPVTVVPSGSAPVRQFSFATLDGGRVTHTMLRGRMTVIATAAPFDQASQAQARFLRVLSKRHKPRLNAMLLMLDHPNNRPLVEIFASEVGVEFPVAFADPATLAGKGPFMGLNLVPTVVILDRQSREVWRHYGLVDAKTLSEAVAVHDTLWNATP